MASSIIGQLRVILGLDTAQFEKGLSDSQRQMTRAARSYEQIGKRIEGVGKSLSIGITLPLVAIGGAALKSASTFESAMNRVEAATGASGKELKALRDQAKAFGADTRVPATAAETAAAMENLAKNGRSVREILGGATEATLKLSAATGGDLPAAADLATDIMAQFGKRADELPGLVDKISGAMVASKLDFDNYRLAIGQAGSVAGNVMGFEAFNAAIAATAAGFSSGSDAGTSFKTFIQRLTPQSKEAAAAIKQLGLDFFDAQGKLKPIGDIAEQLRLKLGRLTKESQGDFLNTIFGSDSSRTAIELMKQGSAGIANMQAQIDKIKASDQAAALMKGWSGAATQVKKAFEAAAISLGDSGFLAGATKVAIGLASLIRMFGQLPAPVLQTAGMFATVAAAAGPVVFIIGKMFSVWGTLLALAPRLAVQLGLVATAETAVGVAGAEAAVGVTLVSRALAVLGGPWGIAIMAIATAIGYLVVKAGEVGPATREASNGLAQLTARQDATAVASDGLAKATGSATDKMEAAIVKARDLATQLYGVEAGAKAAMLALAKQRLADAKHQQAQVAQDDDRSWLGVWMGVPKGKSRRDAARDRTAAGNTQIAQGVVSKAQKAYDEAVADAQRKSTPPPIPQVPIPTGGGNVALTRDTGGGSGGRHKKVEDLAAKRAELELQAQIDAAQERGDETTVQALRDRLDLTRQIAAYEDAGLKKGAATVAAQRDMAAIQTARAARSAEEIARQQQGLAIDVAQISGNTQIVERLERQRDIQERITFYRGQGLDIARATARAEADQVAVDEARAGVRQRWFDQDARDRAIRLAETRGDSEARIRALRVENDIIARQRELVDSGSMSPDAAHAQAVTEAMQDEQARQQGIFRDTIKGGFRAALEGNTGDWFKGWWKDRVAKGTEEALNSLADLIANLFSKTGTGAGSSGGGIGGALSSILDSIIGKRSGPTYASPFAGDGDASKLPGFKSGGSFKIGGMAGVDRNLVMFRGSVGEHVNVTKGEDGGPAGQIVVHMPVAFQGVVDIADKAYVRQAAAQMGASVKTQLTEAQRRRGGRA